MPSCKDMSRLSSRALDEKLPWHQRLGARLHFWMCKACDQYDRQMDFLRKAANQYLRRTDEDENLLPPASLPPEAKERIKQAVREGRD